MNSCLSLCSSFIKEKLALSGACACGIARAEGVDQSDRQLFHNWLRLGYNAGMDYMLRNNSMRFNPGELHCGTRSVIAAAFNYRPAKSSALFADYALGTDYHYVLKQRLTEAAEAICAEFGGNYRVLVDSAPLRERYWAVKAGIGFRADNGLICVPGYGMAVVLGFILWTGETEADTPDYGECLHCRRCSASCPGNALKGNGTLDANRCLSYLTIEHRGDFTESMPRMTKVYGCDCCRIVCPLDRGPVTDIPEFKPDSKLFELSADDLQHITTGCFKQLFRFSPVMRLRPQGLRRNALKYLQGKRLI